MSKQEIDELRRFAAEIHVDTNRGAIATLWLRLRASLGRAEAQFLMGRTLMYGSGLAHPDTGRARTWLIRAVSQGHERALHYLNMLDRNEAGAD